LVKDNDVNVFKQHLMTLIGFSVTVVLTLISIYIVHLSNQGSFVVFSTGTVASVALGLIEERLDGLSKELTNDLEKMLEGKLDLYRLMAEIDDKELRNEVVILARTLGVGEVPAYIAAPRVPKLYSGAQKWIYASNYSPVRERLLQWEANPRLRSIVDMSRSLTSRGVKVTRTFILRRDVVFPDGKIDGDCRRVLERQRSCGIEVRIIWVEDLEADRLVPRSGLMRNFTIFDGVEAIETTDSQLGYRYPSQKIAEFTRVRDEQLKYSDSLEDLVREGGP
jgi:hypothetical protein